MRDEPITDRGTKISRGKLFKQIVHQSRNSAQKDLRRQQIPMH